MPSFIFESLGFGNLFLTFSNQQVISNRFTKFFLGPSYTLEEVDKFSPEEQEEGRLRTCLFPGVRDVCLGHS